MCHFILFYSTYYQGCWTHQYWSSRCSFCKWVAVSRSVYYVERCCVLLWCGVCLTNLPISNTCRPLHPALHSTRKKIHDTTSVTDPDPLYTDPDPAFQFDMDPDPTVWYGSGSLSFQIGTVPKTVLFIHLNVIFLVSRSNRTQPEGIIVKFSLPVNFVMIIRVAYGSRS